MLAKNREFAYRQSSTPPSTVYLSVHQYSSWLQVLCAPCPLLQAIELKPQQVEGIDQKMMSGPGRAYISVVQAAAVPYAPIGTAGIAAPQPRNVFLAAQRAPPVLVVSVGATTFVLATAAF